MKSIKILITSLFLSILTVLFFSFHSNSRFVSEIKAEGQPNNIPWKFWQPEGPDTRQLVTLSPDLFKGYAEGFQSDWDLLEQSGVATGINSIDYLTQTMYVQNDLAFEWMKRNIPYFDCPDKEFMEIYYYRHWMNRLHLKNNGKNFVVTEFVGKVNWGDRYNVINCPAGHQFNWLMWLDNPVYAQSYMDYYMYSPEAKPKLFRDWYADCTYRINQIHPSKPFVENVFDGLKRSFHSYDSNKVTDFFDMYWCNDWNDGFERTIGGSGIRTTINSYMYGNAVGLSKLAGFTGDAATQNKYKRIADTIKNNVQSHLWEDETKFFKTYKNQAGYDKDTSMYGGEDWFVAQPVGQLVDVMEATGFIPWQFNLPDDEPDFAKAWKRIKDSKSGFKAANGLAGAQKDHPRYNIPTPGARWNGLAWFYAETQTLDALANLLNNYSQDVLNKEDYFEVLERYTKKGHYNVYPGGNEVRPYGTEWVDPDKLNEHGRPVRSTILHYFHSGYTDLIINGLIGVRPQDDNSLVVNPLVPEGKWDYFCLDGLKYKGRTICVIWDKNGNKYDKGVGLKVFVDGAEKVFRTDLGKLVINL